MFRRMLLLLMVMVAALDGLAQQDTLKIAAAADLQPVLPALIDQFEKQTHKKVDASYASSATLATQMINGAPFGLFLAADLSFPQKVIAAGLADSSEPAVYARGTLVLWARNDSPVQPLSLDTLRSASLKTVAVANPEHAPYGRAAKAAIEKLGLVDSLKSKLVVAENIAQTAQYADSGNAQAGLISLTSAVTPRLSADGKYVVMPEDSYPPLMQGAVVLKNSPAAGEAHQFLDFLMSEPMRKELAERGLKAPLVILSRMDQQAILLTFRLAALTTLILLVVSIPLAYWLAYSRARWKPLVEAAVALPLVLPPTVLGFYLLVLMGPRTGAGRALAAIFGHPLAFSFAGLLVGSVIFSLPFAVQPLTSGFRSVDRDILEAAELLSSRRVKILARVLLPLVRPFLLTAAVLSFTHTVGEFGVVLMIGGGIPGVTRTLSISIYDQVQDFAYRQANQTALLLLTVSFVALLIIYGRRGRAVV